MKFDQKTRTRITENHSLTITGDELRGLISQELAAMGKERLPDDAYVYVQVPGGGDWSNTELDLSSETSLQIRWTVEKGEGDL
jgi:hypothetical protein